MENAAKALFIAAGVLLAILLLTLFRYLSSQMSDSVKDIYDLLDQSDVAEFNQQFIAYEGRSNLTIQDVVTIVNLAKDANKAQNAPAPVNVQVVVVNGATSEDWAVKYKDMSTEKIIEANIEDVKNNATYSCANGIVTFDADTGLINSITIIKNTP